MSAHGSRVRSCERLRRVERMGNRMLRVSISLALLYVLGIGGVCAADAAPDEIDYAHVRLQSFVKIPLRDGVHLSADVYTSDGAQPPRACVLTMTPYIAQTYHERGVYFAAHGFAFVAVDVRG